MKLPQEPGNHADNYSDEFFAVKLMKDTLGCFLWTFDTRTTVMQNDPAWLAFLGYTSMPEATRLSFWEDIVSLEDQATLKAHFRDLLDGHVDTFNVQYRLVSSQGVEHVIETRAIAKTTDRHGKPRRVVGMHREIADQETSHDLANQMACIIGYADLISRSDRLPESLKGYIHEVTVAAKKAQDLLGANDDEPHPEDGATAVIDIVKATRKICQRYGIQSYHHRDVLYACLGESDLLAILQPLLTNALEAGSNVRQTTLETGTMNFNSPAACSGCNATLMESYCYIQICDQGEGIHQDHLGWIFTPGFSTKAISPQRGKGLSEADECIHNRGGHVTLQSIEGHGTRVTVYLPGTDGQRVKRRNLSDGGHILIVDDEQSVIGYFREVMTQAGYRVTASTDPGEALASFQADSRQFDLVVTDQSMPTMGGDVLIKAMLQIRPELPVILCTGYSETIGQSQARAQGARACIRKPVDMEKLMDLVNKLLRNRSLSV